MYSVFKCVNGNNTIVGEGMTEQAARVSFHQTSANLWNTADVYDADVIVLDEQCYECFGYHEHIHHDKPEQPQNTEEPQGE